MASLPSPATAAPPEPPPADAAEALSQALTHRFRGTLHSEAMRTLMEAVLRFRTEGELLPCAARTLSPKPPAPESPPPGPA